MARGTPKLIDGSNVSSSVLAHLVVSKVIDAIPIERVGKQFARHGADIASSTLNDWYNRCGEEVLFLQAHLHRELLQSQMISLDDTPLPTKHAIAPHGMIRGRLWLYLGDVSRVAYCEHSTDWKGTHPSESCTASTARSRMTATADCMLSSLHAVHLSASDATTTHGASLWRHCVLAIRASSASSRSMPRCTAWNARPRSSGPLND
jgi:hypothetical protein